MISRTTRRAGKATTSNSGFAFRYAYPNTLGTSMMVKRVLKARAMNNNKSVTKLLNLGKEVSRCRSLATST